MATEVIERLAAQPDPLEEEDDEQLAAAARAAYEEQTVELREQRAEAAEELAEVTAISDRAELVSMIEGGVLPALTYALDDDGATADTRINILKTLAVLCSTSMGEGAGAGDATDDAAADTAADADGADADGDEAGRGPIVTGAELEEVGLLLPLIATLKPLMPPPPPPVVEQQAGAGGDEAEGHEEKEGAEPENEEAKEQDENDDDDDDDDDEQDEEEKDGEGGAEEGEEEQQEPFSPCAGGLSVLLAICTRPEADAASIDAMLTADIDDGADEGNESKADDESKDDAGESKDEDEAKDAGETEGGESKEGDQGEEGGEEMEEEGKEEADDEPAKEPVTCADVIPLLLDSIASADDAVRDAGLRVLATLSAAAAFHAPLQSKLLGSPVLSSVQRLLALSAAPVAEGEGDGGAAPLTCALSRRPRARSTAVRVLGSLTKPFDTRLQTVAVAPTLLSVVQTDSDTVTSMARAEALTGLSNLAQHGLRCKVIEAKLEQLDIFNELRACVAS